MKKFVLILAAVMSLSTFAGTLGIYNERDDQGSYLRSSFTINPSLGRAWVEVDFEVSHGESSSITTQKRQVPGLSYDTSSNKILLDYEGQLVECANVIERRVLFVRYNDIRLTGNCKFEAKKIKVQVDDGFHIRNQWYQVVNLSVL